jgi:hypothetical protein
MMNVGRPQAPLLSSRPLFPAMICYLISCANFADPFFPPASIST